jgi:ubiquinone/menaquinone biosynthesis C-methylase UbiE
MPLGLIYNIGKMNSSLNDRLAEISKVFEVERILQRDTSSTTEVSRYYRKNRLAYRLFNSHDGFVHMGISKNNKFSEEDFYTQVRIVNRAIQTVQAINVLELAPGKAATIKYLAKSNPETQFYGIDLESGQLKVQQSTSNLKLSYGDYHDLSQYADESMDLVYVIEALCHAADKKAVIAEVSRVLRPNGVFIIIDGYYAKDLNELPTDQRLACELTAKSMMVTSKNQTYTYLTKTLKQCGFTIREKKNYSKEILPSLHRLELKATKLLKRPRLAKAITKSAGEIVTANAIAGYLMPVCVKEGLFQYRYTYALKAAREEATVAV